MASVESILLYGSETWSVTKAKKLDGCYTKMLCTVFNEQGIIWKFTTSIMKSGFQKVAASQSLC